MAMGLFASRLKVVITVGMLERDSKSVLDVAYGQVSKCAL